MIRIQDYTYDLPQERIAENPLPERSSSKLLVYQDGQITHDRFQSLPGLLPPDSILFFNDTRVIPARLFFKKTSGSVIEIFILNPVRPSSRPEAAMRSLTTCAWHCTIGNLKRWKANSILQSNQGKIMLTANLIDRENGIVEFRWEPADLTFADVLDGMGNTPLPPYIKRNASSEDRERYQTVYSHHAGAVAAPTAGLHFTESILQSLKGKQIEIDFLTLHVSAGTFQPVKTENALDHEMHAEQIVLTRKNIHSLLDEKKYVVAVGTTSMRTLESLYWFGVKLIRDPDADFLITQNDPYQFHEPLPNSRDAIEAIESAMDRLKTNTLIGNTSIYIYPGYTFKICNGLITNFHLPASTLILLVAAFIGPDWKRIYQEALHNNYRFLSYGDSSLLLPKKMSGD